MTERSGTPLNPTFQGYIGSTMDALILFECCLSGRLLHVARRPHDRERNQLIKSGNVFIYEEHSSGIKRWTDGVPWSPSRILGNFLLYRELEKPFTPGEKKRALKKKSDAGIVKNVSQNSRSNSISSFTNGHLGSDSSLNSTTGSDADRYLIGSLVDSYSFKDGGLIKKTISVAYRGVQHHLVSYYSIEDIKANRLITPSHTNSAVCTVVPRPSLISSGNFRAPVHDEEYTVMDPRYYAVTSDYAPQYGLPNRSMSVPALQGYPQSNVWASTPQYGDGTAHGWPSSSQYTSNSSQYTPSSAHYTAGASYTMPQGLATGLPSNLASTMSSGLSSQLSASQLTGSQLTASQLSASHLSASQLSPNSGGYGTGSQMMPDGYEQTYSRGQSHDLWSNWGSQEGHWPPLPNPNSNPGPEDERR
ncbi:Gti1/Pac2 family-domain-containing protein [Xylariaceae sp. FL1019]|nr:Gti1/Pac2 family-domain-containing protein [Xylariaceae sp. FL1019]